MEWNFDELVVQLQRCLPGFPRGVAGLNALVEACRGADRLDSMKGLFEITRRG
jgi:hypothetical protein